MELNLQNDNEQAILSLIRSGRIPHTVIIRGDNKEERDSAALLLAAGAVCLNTEPPCLSCTACRKIFEGTHPDMMTAVPSKSSKTGILSLKELRDTYLSTASIKPNEAPLKIYFFPDADKMLREDAQNTLLKIIEEPPQNILFLFAVEKAELMLPTVRSRAHLIALKSTFSPDEQTIEAVRGIVSGITSLYEYDLLKNLQSLGDKAAVSGALALVIEKLRLALLLLSGISVDDPEAKLLARKLDRARTIALTEITHDALTKLKTNINLQLLLTWLCTQYRRITWQK